VSSTLLKSEDALKILNSTWEEIQKIPSTKMKKKTFVKDSELREKIKRLISSKTKSFRYCVLTQVIAKVTNPSINCLSLQAKAPLPGAFDARSFCKKTVVQIEREKLDNILGGSGDPYVSKPLRREMINLKEIDQIKDKQGWKDLYEVLEQVEAKNDIDFTLKVLKQILLEIRRQLMRKVIRPPSIPPIGVEQLKEVLITYLAKPSGGARPQAIVYALLKTFNDKTKTFAKIDTEKATTADVYAGRVADVECRDDNGTLRLAVGVTDKLDAEKLKSELEKAERTHVKNLLLVGHKIPKRARSEFNDIIKRYNINVAVSSLVEFIIIMTTLLNDQMRQKFVLKVYDALQELEYHNHLREWDYVIKEKLVP